MAAALAIACAVALAGMGVAGLVSPQFVVGRFGIRLDAPDSRTEVRAVYGGYGIAVAALVIWVVATGSPLAPGVLIAMGVSMTGMAAGRLAGAAAERAVPFGWAGAFFLVECALGAAFFVAAMRV